LPEFRRWPSSPWSQISGTIALRRCLTAVTALVPDGKPAVVAVLAHRFGQGFEGRDRRFIAVNGQGR
jgi:hypothetical protein